MAIVTSTSIYRECTKQFVFDTLQNPDYLRQDAFDDFLHRDRVKATIEKKFSSHDAGEKRHLVKYVTQNPRIFLTLSMTKLLGKIPLLYSADFLDDNLPVRLQHEKDGVWRVYSVADDKNSRPWHCFVEGEDEDKNWDIADLRHFVSNQWLFLAVIFKEDRFNYEVHLDCPLPYITLPQPKTEGGGFGKVFKLGLQPAHMSAISGRYLPPVSHDPTSPREVAVKQLRVGGGTNEQLIKFFEKEIRTLKVMRERRHPHLIEAISAYVKGPDRCFVFPWAPGGNLRQLWKDIPGPADQQVTLWALRQTRGLAKGLASLHGEAGKEGTRHGDVKPENILVFGGDDKLPLGELVIADVGIAKFHAEETRERQVQGYVSTSRNGTLRYEPPEIELYKPSTVSRKYDSWSLGCVLLEFIIWLVRGHRGQEAFQNERLATGLKLDRFWDQDNDKKPILHPAATRWIKEELPQYLTPALQDLTDLVANALLVGREKDRKYVWDFCRGLEDIHNSCSANPSYLWNVSDTEMTRRREVIAEVTNDFVVPISQRRTSKLVDRWETVTDSRLSRELLGGLNWAKWPGTRQLAVSPCRICRDCAAIDFAAQSIELRRSLQDLHESADECALCCFLSRRLPSGGAEPQEPLRLVRVGTKIKLFPIDRPIISLYCDSVSGSAPPALPFAQLGLPLLPEAASPEQFSLLNSLVRHCDEKHNCIAYQQRLGSTAELPTRVIDVGGDDSGPIHLVETRQQLGVTGRYIALSHRWGDLSPEQRFCTYKSNIKQRKEHIAHDELPASFQDAVRVTRALGVRYLWIDSLCIIQEDPVDWAAEASRMEDVFSHAYCTIAASSASSSLAGFLGKRPPRDALMLPMSVGAPLYLVEDIDDFRSDVEDSVLSSRGWVLQERALSRRTIFFTTTQVYWECGNGVVCETLAQLRNPQSRFLGDSNFPSFGLEFYKDERIRLVQHFYAEYSALNLSHASDRSQAVAGLQRRIAKAFKSDAAYGVLWRWPERTLLWRAARPGALTRIDYQHGGRCGPPPPSWSWMAYDGRIAFIDIPFAGVEWTGHVYVPTAAAGDRRMIADASVLRVDGKELMARAVLDVQEKFADASWKCVLVGKKKGGEESVAAHYVLIIRPSGLADDVYERIGVATLLASHLSDETSSVFII